MPFDDFPWKEFCTWEEKHIRADRFGSLRGLFAKIVRDAVELPIRFGHAFASNIAVQQPLSEGIQLYLHPVSIPYPATARSEPDPTSFPVDDRIGGSRSLLVPVFIDKQPGPRFSSTHGACAKAV